MQQRSLQERSAAIQSHRKQSRILFFQNDTDYRDEFQSAISLHAHTQYSKEDLSFLPLYAVRIPVVSWLYRLEMKRCNLGCGPGLDFRRGYWVPPLGVEGVYLSERERIHRRLGLKARVSITDHDDLSGPLRLRKNRSGPAVPISTEWTLPYCGRILHLGLHNLPPGEAEDLMRALQRCTRQPTARRIAGILSRVHGHPESLVVLNHPFCDLVDMKAGRQRWPVLRFLRRYGNRIHALEINGYRTWHENRLVRMLARRVHLPVVSGGDRHCWAPNAVLNLSRAASFAGFVEEVRYRKTSTILVMPQYRRSLLVREVEALGDFFRRNPQCAGASTRWTERVFYRSQNEGVRPLADYWKRFVPWWVKVVLGLTSLAANRHIQTALGWISPPNQLPG